MLRLNEEDLNNFCKTNEYVARLCYDKGFWSCEPALCGEYAGR